ncbi:hypothetical protein STANM309S_02575 [Streptomyces tanashiensis]
MSVLWASLKACTFSSSALVCGMREPGTAPRESRKSRISATRMEVSCRQNQRIQPTTPRVGPPTAVSSWGAVDSWAPAASSAARPVSLVSVLLMELRSPP